MKWPNYWINKNYDIKKGVGGRCTLIFFNDNKFLYKKSKDKELEFYSKFQNENKLLIKLKVFLPKIINIEDNYLLMKNIFYKKDHLDIIDIKLGNFTKNMFGNYSKQDNKIPKSIKSTSQELGFRIDGYSIQSNEENKKKEGKKCINLEKTDLVNLLINFFKKNFYLVNLKNKINYLIKIIENENFPFLLSNCSLVIGLSEKENIVKLIDFENTFFNYDLKLNYNKVNYNNIVKGLKNLVIIINEANKRG